MCGKQVTPPKEATKSSASSKSQSVSKIPPYEDDLFSEPVPALMCVSLDPSTAFMALERSASASQVPAKLPRPVSTPAPPVHDDLTHENGDSESLSGPSSSSATSTLRRTASAASTSSRKPLYSRTTSHETPARTVPPSKSPKSNVVVSKLPVQVNTLILWWTLLQLVFFKIN